MKFAMILESTDDGCPGTSTRCSATAVEQCVYGEKRGFDRIWSVEHPRARQPTRNPQRLGDLPLLCGGEDREDRIGHGVICLPFGFSHPVRVAERTAMLASSRMAASTSVAGAERR